jgi:hypothetical protein
MAMNKKKAATPEVRGIDERHGKETGWFIGLYSPPPWFNRRGLCVTGMWCRQAEGVAGRTPRKSTDSQFPTEFHQAKTVGIVEKYQVLVVSCP